MTYQERKYINRFKETRIEHLVKAIYSEDLKCIDDLVKDNIDLLRYSDPEYGTGVLEISVDLEKYESFKKLLELGADPNYVGSIDRYSILIKSIRSFGNQYEWRKDNRYAYLLLEYGANPNYAVINAFEDVNGYYHSGVSPLSKASSENLEMVKMLIKYGANINERIDGELPFGKALNSRKFDIINYYIDSLGMDVKTPIRIRKNDSLYIQDYVVNKFLKAKLTGNTEEMESLKKENSNIEEANREGWEFIQRLESMGVDFRNYNYKK